MTHCTIDELTDHLHGPASEETEGPVRKHLASGCQRCNRLLAALVRVRKVGRFDSLHQPPSGVVRTVKALSGLGRRSHRRSRLVNMRLSFDSLLSPATAGARNLHASSRHLVFYSQDFALDLRMDCERSVRDVVVVGQLLNRDWGPLPDVPAYLMSGEQVVSHTTTGSLGEFHMEGRPLGAMHLQLAVNDRELIDVELDRRQPGDLRPISPVPGERPEAPQIPAPSYSRRTGATP